MKSDPIGSESPSAGHAPSPGAHVNATAWTVRFHPSARLVPSATTYGSSVVKTCCSVPASVALNPPGAPPETVSARLSPTVAVGSGVAVDTAWVAVTSGVGLTATTVGVTVTATTTVAVTVDPAVAVAVAVAVVPPATAVTV